MACVPKMKLRQPRIASKLILWHWCQAKSQRAAPLVVVVVVVVVV